MACKSDLPWPDLFADPNKYIVYGIRQPGNFSATFTVVNPFVYFTNDEQEANWIFSQFVRSWADQFNGSLPFLGSSWHVTEVSQCAIECLMI